MTQKVKPIKMKQMRIRDIPPGEFFSADGNQFLMVNPIDRYNEFLANVIAKDGNDCKHADVRNERMAYVKASVSPINKKGRF